MNTNYIPDRGDIIQIELDVSDSTSGQRGKKNAMVISPKLYNEKTGLAIICPVKSKIKGNPFEVLIPDGLKITGIILSDQVKSINWKIRSAEYVCKIPEGKISEVISKLHTLL